jgi:hypothetical protein
MLPPVITAGNADANLSRFSMRGAAERLGTEPFTPEVRDDAVAFPPRESEHPFKRGNEW